MTKVYVVRHGQSESNAHKEVAGSRESPLTSLGVHQAEIAGERAKGLGITKIIASPLGRAHKTAEIIAEKIGYPTSHIIVMPDLAERNLGELETQSYAKNERHSGNYPETETMQGVELIEQFHGRINHALRTILSTYKNETVLIVCHMNPGRMMQTIVRGRPAIEMYDQPRLENAHIYPLITN